MNRSIGYLAEVFVVYFLALQVASIDKFNETFGTSPLVPEVAVFGGVFLVISLAICAHLTLRVITRNYQPIYGTIAAHAYWYGLLVLALVPTLFLPSAQASSVRIWSFVTGLASMPLQILAIWLYPAVFWWLSDVNSCSKLKAFAAYWLGAFIWGIVVILPLTLLIGVVHGRA